MKKNLFFIACFFTLILIACTRPAGSESHERTIFYVATTGNDSNRCTERSAPCLTIRGALEKVDADDQIIIAAGTYNETPGYGGLPIAVSLWIQGEGPGRTIIDLGGVHGGFHINDHGSVRLEGFTIQNAGGDAPGFCIDLHQTRSELDSEPTVTIENVEATRCYPSGIYNGGEGLVTLTNVSVSQSGSGVYNRGEEMVINGSAIGGNDSQGVINRSVLTISDSTIENNNGEGILLTGGEAALSGVVIRNNGLDGSYVAGLRIDYGAAATVTGGDINNNPLGIRMLGDGSTLIMEGSTVRENVFTGILVQGGSAQLTNVNVSSNSTRLSLRGTSIGYGIENDAQMLIRNSRISENLNGGLRNEVSGVLTIVETSFEGNQGGLPALLNLGNASIENSLIAHNTSTSPISGVATAVVNHGEMRILNTTISGNQGTGVWAGSGTLYMKYVTIAENSDVGLSAYHGGEGVGLIENVLIVKNGGRGNCVAIGFGYPALPLSGINIETEPVSAPDACGFPEVYSDTEIQLDVLADNGGPTLTHALLTGSPAIDAATGACPVNDQRLAPRPVGLACDVGAYEAGAAPTSLDFPTPTTELPMLTLTNDFPCYTGPGPAYNTLSTLRAGTQLQIVGYGFGGGWLVAFYPNLQGQHCWIDEDFVTTNVPVGDLRLISVPPKPTSTPSATPEIIEPAAEEPTPCATTPIDLKACD
jgi:hypothetical protein